MTDNGRLLRIDPHVHSEGSYDGHEPVELLLEHAAEIGLDGIVVTDHDEIDKSLRAAALAPNYGLVGIPGVEISTAHGHLLALGVDRCPPRGLPFDETVGRIRAAGGIAVVPHPFQRSRHGVRKRHIDDADGVEVYNSMLFTGYRNRRANRFAERHQFPKLGASDAHYLGNVGRAYTEVKLDEVAADKPIAALDGETVIDAIRAGKTSLRGKRTPINRSVRQYGKGSARKAVYLLTRQLPYLRPWPTSMHRNQ